jgi:hypothetical protein
MDKQWLRETNSRKRSFIKTTRAKTSGRNEQEILECTTRTA